MENVTALSAARKSSGLLKKDCAEMFDISLPTYGNIEDNDDLMTLGQIKTMLPHLNDISRKILKDRVDEIFLT